MGKQKLYQFEVQFISTNGKMLASVSTEGKVPYGYLVDGIKVFDRKGEICTFYTINAAKVQKFSFTSWRKTVALKSVLVAASGEQVFFANLSDGCFLCIEATLAQMDNAAGDDNIYLESLLPDKVEFPLLKEGDYFRILKRYHMELLGLDTDVVLATFRTPQKALLQRYQQILDEAKIWSENASDVQKVICDLNSVMEALNNLHERWSRLTLKGYLAMSDEEKAALICTPIL